MHDHEIKFLLNGKPVCASGAQPTLTLLQFLRQDCALPGTKEGCAEGDCGACTVMVTDLDVGGGVRHRAVNSCIQFLPTLHGKAVTTVEGIAAADGTPHPVQRAMVDCHASQCGFCTPGFVMSLYADYRSHAPRPVARPEIDNMLSGNLCRCTGYRPIADAAQAALAAERGAVERMRDAEYERGLKSLARSCKELVIDGAAGKWFSPHSEESLARCLAAHPDARIVAGLTDVGLWSTKQLRALPKLVSVGGIESLRRVRRSGRLLEIGAAVAWSDAMPALLRHWPAMRELLERFASPPVRNSATVGGNVANGSPIGDSMPAFLALGAAVVLRGAQGERVMPLDAFYLAYQKTALAPGEYVAALRLPLPAENLQFRTYKLSKRFDQDISAVCAAFAIVLKGEIVVSARIAFGGMAATPSRALHVERALVGNRWDRRTVIDAKAALADNFAPITDMRASASYRSLAAGNLLDRFFLETTASSASDTLVRLGQLEVQA